RSLLPLAPSHLLLFFLTHPAPTEIYSLSLHDALPICLILDLPPRSTGAHHRLDRARIERDVSNPGPSSYFSLLVGLLIEQIVDRSEERRVGKERRSRRARYHYKNKDYTGCERTRSAVG